MSTDPKMKMIILEERILQNISDYNSSLDEIIERLENLRLTTPIRIRDIEESRYNVDKIRNTELRSIKDLLESLYDNQTYLNELIVDELRRDDSSTS